MHVLSALVLTVLALAAAPWPADAQSPDATAVVCPAPADAETPPDFTGPDCEATPLYSVDPQGRMIWVRTDIPVVRGGDGAPLGLFLSAKASSRAWIDGVPAGQNGAPGARRELETPGLMDAVLPVPTGAAEGETARVVLLMSSHRGYLRLGNPVHSVAIAPYQPPQYMLLRYYWPILITFGALLAGGLYFAAMALAPGSRRAAILLSAMSLLAAAQLFAETARGLFPYAYPVQDLRLILILVFALGFGLCLAAHIIAGFGVRRGRALFAAIAVLTVALSVTASGFDMKTALALLVPVASCAAAAGVWTLQRRPRAVRHLIALTVFAVLIAASPTRFLDAIFYLVVAGFLIFLFVQQALELGEERRLRAREAARASRLALVLEQRNGEADAARPEAIAVTGAGRTDRVPIADIAYVQGAGDYVELHLLDGRVILHSDSLNALEDSLPASFVRVRRSHIVNTAHVLRLEREAGGTGRLILSNGEEAPVSRRILPRVREALV